MKEEHSAKVLQIALSICSILKIRDLYTKFYISPCFTKNKNNCEVISDLLQKGAANGDKIL